MWLKLHMNLVDKSINEEIELEGMGELLGGRIC